MAEHTPTPWFAEFVRWNKDAPAAGFAIRSDYSHLGLPDGMRMCAIASGNLSEHASFTACFTPEEIEANASFIVLACNNHARLTRENEAMRKALLAAEQRSNESGTGEIGLLDTVHAVAGIVRAALASLKEPGK